jgi:hypothetical protein
LSTPTETSPRLIVRGPIAFSVVPTGLFKSASQPRTASWAKFSRPCGTQFHECGWGPARFCTQPLRNHHRLRSTGGQAGHRDQHQRGRRDRRFLSVPFGWCTTGGLSAYRCREFRDEPRLSPSAFGNSGLTKDSQCAIEAGFRGGFRCHVFRSPEDFHAERIVVVDALERLQKAGQVDDPFTG